MDFSYKFGLLIKIWTLHGRYAYQIQFLHFTPAYKSHSFCYNFRTYSSRKHLEDSVLTRLSILVSEPIGGGSGRPAVGVPGARAQSHPSATTTRPLPVRRDGTPTNQLVGTSQKEKLTGDGGWTDLSDSLFLQSGFKRTKIVWSSTIATEHQLNIHSRKTPHRDHQRSDVSPPSTRRRIPTKHLSEERCAPVHLLRCQLCRPRRGCVGSDGDRPATWRAVNNCRAAHAAGLCLCAVTARCCDANEN